MPTRNYSASLWPTTLIPKNVSVTIDRPLYKGPKPLTGREQVVAVDSGGWLINYDNIVLGGAAKFLAFRTIWAETVAAGLPVYVRPDFGPHTARVRLGMTSSPTTCTLSVAATKGATSITVSNTSGYALQAGDYFEINGRLHIIRSISSNVWTIWPPLRANYVSGSYASSYPLGTQLEIYDPRCLMYITPDSRSNVMTLNENASASVSVEFIEASW